MTALITEKFKEHVAQQLIESITEPANNVYYIVASKHTPYANDDTTPIPGQSIKETVTDVYQEGIFGKKINSNDISMVVPKYVWTANTKYGMYDDQDEDLYNKQYYVAVDSGATYYVYKVLDNNRDAASTEQPTNTSESACNFITTSDGYTWKLMYKMAEASFEKFTTTNYMPVTTSANVAGNTVSGAIDVIKIINTGSNYVSTLTGQFQSNDVRESIPSFSGNTTTYRLSQTASSNNDFYTTSAIYISAGTGAGQIKSIISYSGGNRVIVVNSAFSTPPDNTSEYVIAPRVIVLGDGSGATGYATVSSNASVNNFISKINMVSRGANYTHASATVVGNTGGVSNTAVLRPIIPPPGGHGFDASSELGSDSLTVSTTFNQTESGFVTTENDFRKIVLLKDPLFTNVTLTMGNTSGTFVSNENVYQVDYKTLVGVVACNTTSTTITGTGTEFDKALKAGDNVIIYEQVSGLKSIKTVDSVTNSSVLSLTSNAAFLSNFSIIAHAAITATGKRTGNSTPYLTMSNVEPKFVTGKMIIGQSSGAYANVTDIDVNEKNYNNWNTFDNRTRISYTSSSGSMPEDAKVFQTEVTLSNAFFHSANNTYVFLTSEKGPINADPSEQLREDGGSATYTLGSNKYSPDIVRNSGMVLYIENNAAISRSNSQSENIKLTIKF